MDFLDLTEYILTREDQKLRGAVGAFLQKQGLRLEEGVDYTYALVEGNELVATGSLEKNVIKCVAVRQDYQNMGLTNKVISQLVYAAHKGGKEHLFIYTKPGNLQIFTDLGFYKIMALADKVVLLENKRDGIRDFVLQIKQKACFEGRASAVVVNCNPFTLGHQYLIEQAAEESEFLYVLVVSEDRSVFPADVRLKLVQEGTDHLKNILVQETGSYLISSATFPSYFLKEESVAVSSHAALDLEIFANYFASTLNISRRYVGEEPYCSLTKAYNEKMKAILPSYGIVVREIPRREAVQQAISASWVRGLLKENRLEEVKALVPETTYRFLMTEEGRHIIDKLKGLRPML